MKQVLDRVKRGADGAGIHFSYSVDPEDIVTYTEAEYKKLADSQKEDLIFDPTTKLWWRMESAVFLEFGDFQGKGWKVMARLEPMNNTTEKDRVWRAFIVSSPLAFISLLLVGTLVVGSARTRKKNEPRERAGSTLDT